MPDRPIIFSSPMIRALLEGRKTQTRRVLKPQPVPCLSWSAPPAGTYPSDKGWSRLPYAIGDRLWVREAFATNGPIVRYYATDDVHELRRKRSPIHMPRWASRLTLIVTDVRVQRAQEISEADAEAEGATSRPSCSGFLGRDAGWSMDWSRIGQMSRYAMCPPGSPAKTPLKATDISLCDPRMAFASYWNSIHGPAAWDANPWVAAISFDVRRGNIEALAGDGPL